MTKNRKELIDQALTAYKESGNKLTLNIEYRGVSHVQEVVTLNVDVPLLNHNNSRLRAQLKTHPKRDVVRNDPESSEAQEILSDLLRATEKFKDLKRELLDFKQLDPGIITRDGMLINGNTRLVACRDLNFEGFSAAVLPMDATSTDLFEIESSLQLRKTTHQDYTLTNRLLLVEELWEKHQNEKNVAAAMNWTRGAKKVNLSRRMLEIIEQVRDMAPQELGYQYFDSKEEMLKDLDREYQALVHEDPEAAENLKWNRITGMLVGLNKDEVRAIDEDFVDSALISRIQDDETKQLIESVKKTPTKSALADLLEPSDNSTSYDMSEIAKKIISNSLEEGSLDPAKIDKFSNLYNAMRLGARNTIESELQKNMLNEPIAYLNEVKLKIEELTGQLPEFVKAPGFDKQKFVFEAKKTLKALGQLQDELNRQLQSD